jgi:hypothetical protein
MADITMCGNKDCTLKETCYRFTAIANPYRQSYAGYQQGEDGKCDDYWDNKPKKKQGDTHV